MNPKILLLLLSCSWLNMRSIATDLPPLRSGQDYALFFAVGTYEYMDDLQNPIRNAEEIAKELRDNFGFRTELIRNPSIDDIDNKLAEYERNFNNGTFDQKGQLFIYFSGHGIAIQDNGYFMTPSADPARPHRTAMDYDFYRNKIDQIACQHIMVAIDACHSATFDPKYSTRSERKYGRPGEREFDRVLANHESYRTRVFWTSDGEGSETPDRSSFAYQLLEGLRSHQSPTHYLRSKELYTLYLEKAAPRPGGGSFGSDEPNSCFLFFRNARVNIGDARADLAAWQLAQQTNTLPAYRQYLRDYPTGDFSFTAQEKITGLENEESELLAWSRTKQQDTKEAYQAFIKEYPNSLYVFVAQQKLRAVHSSDPPDNFIRIEGGTFEMGDQYYEGRGDEKPIHSVEVSTFYLSPTEVTFDAYDTFCTATGRNKPDDEGWGRGQHPAINVSWCDAIEYANWLSEQNNLQKVYSSNCDNIRADWNANGYRLPTEAEWEYAARQGGQKVRFGNGKDIADPAEVNFNGSRSPVSYAKEGVDRQRTVLIGSLNSPNSLGLHDMSGNVWEWCWDWHESYYYSNSTGNNPRGPASGKNRVVRGGSWYNVPAGVRCTNRYCFSPDYRDYSIGFRLARFLK